MSVIPSELKPESFLPPEGGSSHVLALLMERDDLDPTMTSENTIEILCAEVVKLRSQLVSLQTTVAELTQQRDKMTSLIWNELSRLASRVDGKDNPLDSPMRQLIDPSGKVNDPVLKALLAASPSSNGDEEGSPLLLDKSRSHKRLRTCLEGGEARSPRRVDRVSSGTDEDGHERRSAAESANEQSSLIEQWINKQLAGTQTGSELMKAGPEWEEGDWWCFVCNKLAKDGPPGRHFCWSRFSSEHQGIKVYCQYCRKGTARMPDLRVHFKKIVYCRVLRESLERAWANTASTKNLDGPSLLTTAPASLDDHSTKDHSSTSMADGQSASQDAEDTDEDNDSMPPHDLDAYALHNDS